MRIVHAVLLAMTLAGGSHSFATVVNVIPPKSKKEAKPRGKSKVRSLQGQTLCYELNGREEFVGEDRNAHFPIASLSKAITTHWAVSQYGANHRFETMVHVLPVENGSVDVHLQGDFDPFFSNDRLQFMAAQLNALGIKKIRNLTFDENFVFIQNLEFIASGNPVPHDPLSERTMRNLRGSVTNLKQSYIKTKRKYKTLFNESLPESISLNVGNIEFLSSNEFRIPVGATTYSFYSAPITTLLLEMNRHSNNHVADLFFQGLGGVEKFKLFQQNVLRLSDDNFLILNGSGMPMLESKKKQYSEANCTAMLTVLKSLKSELEKQNLDISDVLATVGSDAVGEERSALSRFYDSKFTHMTVSAKTGTVDNIIALAGEINSQKGEISFVIFQPTRSASEWNRGREAISKRLDSMMEDFGSLQQERPSVPFLSFDTQSVFRKVH